MRSSSCCTMRTRIPSESVLRQEQLQQSGLGQNGGILSAAINQADQFTKRMRNSAIEPGVHRGTSYVQSPSGFEERQIPRSGTAGKRDALPDADKTIRRGIFSGIFSGGRSGSFGTGRTGGGSFSSRGGSFDAGRTGSGGFSGGQRVQFEGGPRLETIEKSANRFNGERGSSFSSRDFQKQPKSGTGTAGTTLQPRTAQQPGETLNTRQDSPPLSREDQALQTRFKPAQQKARQAASLDTGNCGGRQTKIRIDPLLQDPQIQGGHLPSW